jgi:hypothetical protein
MRSVPGTCLNLRSLAPRRMVRVPPPCQHAGACSPLVMQHRGERVVACARRRACLPAQACCLPASLSGCPRGASARNRRARAIPVEPAGTGERQGSGSESTRAAGSTFGPSLLTPPVPPAARAADRLPRERPGPPPHPRGRRRGSGCWRARRPPRPDATSRSRRAPHATVAPLQPHEGFDFTILDAQLTDRRLLFTVDPRQLWMSWCELQTSYPCRPARTPTCACPTRWRARGPRGSACWATSPPTVDSSSCVDTAFAIAMRPGAPSI